MNSNMDAEPTWESQPAETSAEALDLLTRYTTNRSRLQGQWDEIIQEHSSGWVAVTDDGNLWTDESHQNLIQRLLQAGLLSSAAIEPLEPLRNFVASV